MAPSEFSIIRQYFHDLGEPSANTVLGNGDDAAVVTVPDGFQQVVCMDTLNEGIHLPTGTDAADVGYKSLAVNLSDLAAMAATPDWFLLSLSLPRPDSEWLQRFAGGLAQAAERFGIQLLGGDTCRGPLSITVQAAGLVPARGYVTRAGAQPGDLVVVSGQLGNAGLGLALQQGKIELPEGLRQRCADALNRPLPRLELREFLREYASAAIDISDGLQGDLMHVLESSDCGASIVQASLPVDAWVAQQGLYRYALEAGDDYEICCTIPQRHRQRLEDWNRQQGDCPLTVIGEITPAGFRLVDDERVIDLAGQGGFNHFG